MVERIRTITLVNWRRQRRVLSILLGLLLPAVLHGQEPSPEPVPAEMLGDGELVVESHNFAVRSPAGDWRWFLMKRRQGALSLDVYLCEEADSGAIFQISCTGLRYDLDARAIQGFEDGVKESLVAGGMKLVSMETTDSPVPAPHSYRGRWHALLPDGQSFYGYAYLAPSETVFHFVHVTTEATEPPEFTQFVKTFRTLRAPLPDLSSGFMPKIHFLLVAIGCAVAWQVNRTRGRMVLNGGTVGAVLVIAMMVVFLVIGGYVCLSTGQPPEKTGEMTGRCIGEALIPLLIAVLISRVFRARNRSRRSLDGEAQATQEH